MPVRRLNYTSRVRIYHDDVDIVLLEQPGKMASFHADLKLADYQFPDDARVVVEAYRQTFLMRFDFGTVGNLQPPPERTLVEFPTPHELLFRVKVTAVSGRAGLLLGEADKIRPRHPDEEPDRRLPLLPPFPEDLGEEIWRVEYSGGTMLAVNQNLADWKETVRSPIFRALVYPAAMREILERVLFVEKCTSSDDPSDWRCRWLAFAGSMPGAGPVPRTTEDQLEWVEQAVSAFARRYRLRSALESEAGAS